MHILRVCKSNGYSVFDLYYLFNSLIMSLFTYCIHVWGVVAFPKYLSQIDRLKKRALKFGYIQQVTSIQQVLRNRIVDTPLHPLQDLLPPRRSRAIRGRLHPYQIPCVGTQRFKKCFVNNNNLLLIRHKLACEYDQMHLTIISFTILKSNQKLVLRRAENRSTWRKTSRSRVENHQSQPTYDTKPGNRTWDTLVEGSTLTTAPTLLPLNRCLFDLK